MKTTNEAAKELRAIAKSKGLVFKAANERHNGVQAYCFFGVRGRASDTQTLKAWRDCLLYGNVQTF
jgi:hypothetical protein